MKVKSLISRDAEESAGVGKTDEGDVVVPARHADERQDIKERRNSCGPRPHISRLLFQRKLSAFIPREVNSVISITKEQKERVTHLATSMCTRHSPPLRVYFHTEKETLVFVSLT